MARTEQESTREMDKADFLQNLDALKGDLPKNPIFIHDGGEELFAVISLADLERFRLFLATSPQSSRQTGKIPATGQWLEDGPIAMQALFSMARDMMQGDQRVAERWMGTPQGLFGGGTPRAHARTEEGTRDVANLIARIRYGIAS